MKRKKMDINSIKIRLVIILITICLFIIFILSYAGFMTFEKTLIKEIGNNRSDVLSQISAQIRKTRNNAYTLSNLYYYDSILNQYIREMDKTPLESMEKLKIHMDKMTEQYQKSFNESNMEFTVVLVTEKGKNYASFSCSESYDYMNPKTKIWYKKMLAAEGHPVDVANYEDKFLGKSYFTVARCIEDEEKQPIAYLMINIDEQEIYEMYEAVTAEDRTVYIVDAGGNIISSSNRKLNGTQFFHMKNLDKVFNGARYTITEMYGKDILFTKYLEPASGITVLEEISLTSLLEPINQVKRTILAIDFMIVLVAIFYTVHFAGRVTRPISKLCDFMMQTGKDTLHADCNIEGYTEIKILSVGLNGLLGRVRKLMEDIRLNESQKREMELGFLQAQINPHFMYNTLFSIKCMVDMEKNDEASKMLLSFIQILRSTLSNPEEFVEIGQEFKMLEQYAQLQKLRYTNPFEVVFECDSEIENKKIPKLLIQPLLENAIFHGVEFRQEEGLIIISARKQNEDIVVAVEDNGIGIEPTVLERINRGEKLNDKEHVGVANVRERMQLYFGEQSCLNVESRQWTGTIVKLRFPGLVTEER